MENISMAENDKKKKKKKKKHPKLRAFIKINFFLITIAICVAGFVLWNKFGPTVMELYNDAQLKVSTSDEDVFKAVETSLVYDCNKKLITSLKGEKDVYYVDIKDIPEYAQQAMVSIEDKKFYEHKGIDIKANFRAVVALIKHKGKVTQGASTITQQLSRNIYLTHQVSWQRKVEEIFIALELEKKYSKDQIMEFYLNNAYFGNGYYGIQAASNGYFRKGVSSLSLSQITFLCAIPNNPSLYDPLVRPENTIKRRDRILKQMKEDGVITEEERLAAVAEEIKVQKPKKSKKDYVTSYVLSCATKALMEAEGFKFQTEFSGEASKKLYDEEYEELYAKCQKALYTGGYRIYTSIDPTKQKQLQASIDETLAGFTETNDDGIYAMQGAATCIDNETGRVIAIVGGRSQKNEGYTLNRAFQSPRQPGSSIKPLVVYTPVLERGFSPDSIVDDSRMPDDYPSNSNGKYDGNITLRRAVQASKNVVAWRLFEELTPRVGVSYLGKMNFSRITEQDYENMAAALGGFAYGATTVEMASAYATIENHGLYRQPTCIVKIMNTDGDTVVSDKQEAKRVYQENASLMMTDVLKSVITGGTAAGLGVPNMDCAAKTGTTNDKKDGWLCGFSPYYTTCVWVGYDVPRTVSDLYGSTYPGRIWSSFMRTIHEGLERRTFDPYNYVKGINMSGSDTETENTEETEEEKTTEDTQEEPTEEEPTEAPSEEPSSEEGTTEFPSEVTTEPPEEVTTEAPLEVQKIKLPMFVITY